MRERFFPACDADGRPFDQSHRSCGDPGRVRSAPAAGAVGDSGASPGRCWASSAGSGTSLELDSLSASVMPSSSPERSPRASPLPLRSRRLVDAHGDPRTRGGRAALRGLPLVCGRSSHSRTRCSRGGPEAYVAELPGSRPQQWEALSLALRVLARQHPGHFALDRDGERWRFTNRALDAGDGARSRRRCLAAACPARLARTSGPGGRAGPGWRDGGDPAAGREPVLSGDVEPAGEAGAVLRGDPRTGAPLRGEDRSLLAAAHGAPATRASGDPHQLGALSDAAAGSDPRHPARVAGRGAGAHGRERRRARLPAPRAPDPHAASRDARHPLHHPHLGRRGRRAALHARARGPHAGRAADGARRHAALQAPRPAPPVPACLAGAKSRPIRPRLRSFSHGRQTPLRSLRRSPGRALPHGTARLRRGRWDGQAQRLAPRPRADVHDLRPAAQAPAGRVRPPALHAGGAVRCRVSWSGCTRMGPRAW